MTPTRALVLRAATTLVVLPLVLLLVWAPQARLLFSLFITALAAVGLYEYYAIVRCRQISPETIGGILAGAAVTLSGHWDRFLLTALLLYGGCLLVSALHIARGQTSLTGLATSMFGILYIGWFAAHMVLLRASAPFGSGLVTLLVVAVSLTDIAAYLVGSLLGRHKLAPGVSPGKTWEGAIGGFLATVLGMAALWAVSRRWGALPAWSLGRYAGAGALLSLVAQVGDLAESCLKRSAGVKDSGGLFPGHGGVLDRCDGFLFAAPALYYMVCPFFG